MQQRTPALAQRGHFRASKINLPVDCHQQLHRLHLPIVRRKRSSRVDKLIGQVFDRMTQNFQRMARLRRNPAAAQNAKANAATGADLGPRNHSLVEEAAMLVILTLVSSALRTLSDR